MRRLLLLGIALVVAGTAFVTPSQVFGQDGLWQTYNRVNSQINADTVIAIGFDGNDGVWSATRYGVQSFINNVWTDYVDLTKIPSNDIWDIENANGTMYFGTRTGLTAYDGSNWTTYTSTNSGLTNAPVLCLKSDAFGNLWIGTARGMNSLSSSHVFTTYKHATVPAMPYDGIQDIATAPNGDVWIVFIATKGIVKFPAGSSAQAIYYKQDTIPNMPNDYITNITIDHSGNLWAGMKLTGVVRINAAGSSVFNAGNTPAIHNNIVNKIAVDVCGNVWVATQHGTAMYDGSTWKAVPTDAAHVPNDTVKTLAVDSRGHVWFGSYDGLTIFKPLPQVPQLLAPPMAASISTDSVTCSWVWDCPGILKYWHEIADNPSFVNSHIDTTSASLMQSASKWDTIFTNNTTYYWRVKAKNDAGWGPFSNTWTFTVHQVSGVPSQSMMATHCTLDQNFPNPCIDRTTVGFFLPEYESVSLAIYDVLGRECAMPLNSVMGPGRFSVSVDAMTLPHNGVYVYRLRAGDQTQQRTMQVVR